MTLGMITQLWFTFMVQVFGRVTAIDSLFECLGVETSWNGTEIWSTRFFLQKGKTFRKVWLLTFWKDFSNASTFLKVLL